MISPTYETANFGPIIGAHERVFRSGPLPTESRSRSPGSVCVGATIVIAYLLRLLIALSLMTGISRAQAISTEARPITTFAPVNVLTLLSDIQIADVRSGHPALDLSTLLNAVLNACAAPGQSVSIRFPGPGTYGIGNELVAAKCPVEIIIDRGASIVQIADFPVGEVDGKGLPLTRQRGMIRIMPAAAGSHISGDGTIDGNRAALVSLYLATPKAPQPGLYAMAQEWSCVLIKGARDVVINGLTLRNCMTSGAASYGGDGIVFRDLTIGDSSKAIAVQGGGDRPPGQPAFCCNGDTRPAHHVTIENIRAYNIGNNVGGTPIPFWQYGFEIRDLIYYKIRDISIEGYHPVRFDTAGNRIGDPQGAAIVMERMFFGDISGINITGLDDTATSKMASSGLWLNGFFDSHASNISIKGAYWGLEIDGAQRSTLDRAVLDCNWNTSSVSGFAQGAGLRVKGNAILPSVRGLTSQFDHWSMMPAYALTVTSVFGTRCAVGAQIMSAHVSIGNSAFNANAKTGVLAWATELHTETYPALVPPDLSDLSLADVETSYNGQVGLQFNDGVGAHVSNLRANNNGQDPGSAGPSYQAGIAFAGPTAKPSISLSNWAANDTQGFTRAKAISFAPGATKADNQIVVVINSGRDLAVGQHILVKNGSGVGDIDARIMDITNDYYTLRTRVPTTLSENGNLTKMAGTVSVSAGRNVLIGKGTSFTRVITGPVFIKIQDQYLKVGRVMSDTVALLDTTAGAAIADASAEMVQCDLAGIPSQRFGLYLSANSGVSGLSFGPWGSYQATNMVAGTFIGSIGALADGQEFLLESGPVHVTRSSTNVFPTIAAAEAASLLPASYTFQVMQTVANTSGLKLLGQDDHVSVELFGNISPAKNNTARGRIMHWPASSGDLRFGLQTVDGNVPSNGQVRLGILFRKVVPPPYPSVP